MKERVILRCILIAAFVIHFGNVVYSQQPYKSYDFEGTISSEWSHTNTYTAPSVDNLILGHFWNDTIRLSLDNLPEHSEITISFDLFIIFTWDGWNDMFGPDIFGLQVDGGQTLLHTNIAAWDGHRQSYPENYPGGDYPARYGADEYYTWQGSHPMFTIYRGQDTNGDGHSMTFTFAHSDNSIEIEFYGQGLQTDYKDWGIDEGWGIDNVCVTLTSAPAGTLSGCIWMESGSDFGYSLDEGDWLYFVSFWPVWYYNFTTGEWGIEGPVDWIYVDWPFIYVLATDTYWFVGPPESGLWVYHLSTGEWELLPQIIP